MAEKIVSPKQVKRLVLTALWVSAVEPAEIFSCLKRHEEKTDGEA